MYYYEIREECEKRGLDISVMTDHKLVMAYIQDNDKKVIELLDKAVK